MGLDVRDFWIYVVVPALTYLHPEIPHSRAAERLVLATAIHESGSLRWLDQTTPGPGPARGMFQIEAATHQDLWTRFIAFRPALNLKLRALVAQHPSPLDQLRTNLIYACAMARVVYFRSPDPMPDVADVPALAAMCKRVYNTSRGAATVDDYRRALVKCAELFE